MSIVSTPALQFSASAQGLHAQYNLIFGGANSALQDLSASFQGDYVKVKSLHVQCISSPYDVNISLNGSSIVIPAFSDTFIDVSHATSVIFSCSQVTTITLEFMSYVVPYVSSSRGLIQPSGLIYVNVQMASLAVSTQITTAWVDLSEKWFTYKACYVNVLSGLAGNTSFALRQSNDGINDMNVYMPQWNALGGVPSFQPSDFWSIRLQPVARYFNIQFTNLSATVITPAYSMMRILFAS
ncbi:MAG: hypothetical protein ACYDAO_09420 [Thermoplasmataceae archaeon]